MDILHPDRGYIPRRIPTMDRPVLC